MMTRLIPKIFYSRMGDGLDFFVMGLGFKVVYQDGKLAVIERDGARAYLVEDAEFAVKGPTRDHDRDGQYRRTVR
jgi:hypothetical protein